SPMLPMRSLGPLNRLSHRLVIDGAARLYRKQIAKWRQDVLTLPAFTAPPGPVATLYAYSPSVLPKPADWGEDVHVTGYWFLSDNAAYQPDAALAAFLASDPAPV